MKKSLIISILLALTGCRPKYVYKLNGIPIISCADLNNEAQPLSRSAASECLNRNLPLFQKIYQHELTDYQVVTQSTMLNVCIAPTGQANVSLEGRGNAAKSQLEKFISLYVEQMEFPKSSSRSCYKVPFIFKMPEIKA